jgi:hypothetical protein
MPVSLLLQHPCHVCLQFPPRHPLTYDFIGDLIRLNLAGFVILTLMISLARSSTHGNARRARIIEFGPGPAEKPTQEMIGFILLTGGSVVISSKGGIPKIWPETLCFYALHRENE